MARVALLCWVVAGAASLTSASNCDLTLNPHLNETEGTLTSPNYPSRYPDNLDCKYVIKVEDCEEMLQKLCKVIIALRQ